MWNALFGEREKVFRSLLLSRCAGRDDQQIANSVVLDLCLYLTLQMNLSVLWIRSERFKNDAVPELFEANDCEGFLAEALSTATASAKRNDTRTELEVGLQQISIKYVADYAQLVSLLVNVHLVQPRVSAIVIGDAEILCGSSGSNFMEVSALAAEAVQSTSVNSGYFISMSVAMGTGQASTARLAPFYEARFDLDRDPDGKTWSIEPVRHGSVPTGSACSASSIQFRRRNIGSSGSKFIPGWYWTLTDS